MAPVLKILGVPRLPPGGSLGTGKRGTVPKIWRAVPIFLALVNGVIVACSALDHFVGYQLVFFPFNIPSSLPCPSQGINMEQ